MRDHPSPVIAIRPGAGRAVYQMFEAAPLDIFPIDEIEFVDLHLAIIRAIGSKYAPLSAVR